VNHAGSQVNAYLDNEMGSIKNTIFDNKRFAASTGGRNRTLPKFGIAMDRALEGVGDTILV
jgi:hypothetical protein